MVFGEYMNDRSLYLKAMLVNVAYDISNGYNKVGWPQNISVKSDKGYEEARRQWKKLSVDKGWSNRFFADSMYIKIRNVMQHDPKYGSYASVLKLLASDLDGTIAKITDAINGHKDSLAYCEHNRWTMQQLILGYSPADEVLDKIFEDLENKVISKQVATDRYRQWKLANLRTSELRFENIKDDVKASSLRIHPNICSMEHLSKVDAGAVPYDEDLNAAIPTVIKIVDGYRS
jgi:hypothetical protein